MAPRCTGMVSTTVQKMAAGFAGPWERVIRRPKNFCGPCVIQRIRRVCFFFCCVRWVRAATSTPHASNMETSHVGAAVDDSNDSRSMAFAGSPSHTNLNKGRSVATSGTAALSHTTRPMPPRGPHLPGLPKMRAQFPTQWCHLSHAQDTHDITTPQRHSSPCTARSKQCQP
jgi:hypothetical protein